MDGGKEDRAQVTEDYTKHCCRQSCREVLYVSKRYEIFSRIGCHTRTHAHNELMVCSSSRNVGLLNLAV